MSSTTLVIYTFSPPFALHGASPISYPALTDAGWTLQCGVPLGLVAMSIMLLARLDQGSAIALLLLVSASDTGDFLVGSGARNPYEGPAAGACATVVIPFSGSQRPTSPPARQRVAFATVLYVPVDPGCTRY